MELFGQQFLNIDNQLFFGVGYFLLIRIFENMGYID